MTETEIAQRLGVAIAIGALVGAERHWRERSEDDGKRTAGLRTYTMIGMLGGLAGALEVALRGTGAGVPGLLLTGFGLALSAIFALFHFREQRAEGTFSVTSVVAAMLTFALGGLAVLGHMRLAGALGVVLVAILAAREALHRFVEALSFAELRSAIVLLAMTFVILPLVPADPVGPFGGVSPARVWMLAILLAAISFVGYATVKVLGERHGELVAGAVGGLLSSTAATITNARRSAGGGEPEKLAAGALGAGVVSYLRTSFLVLALAPSLFGRIAPALGAAAAAAALAALFFARRDSDRHETVQPVNPFDLARVFQLALLLAAIDFATRAASLWFGESGVVAVAAITGLGDVDPPVIAAASLLAGGLSAEAATLAILAATATNTAAKAAYGAMLGSRRFGLAFVGASAAALAAGSAAHWLTRSIG